MQCCAVSGNHTGAWHIDGMMSVSSNFASGESSYNGRFDGAISMGWPGLGSGIT